MPGLWFTSEELRALLVLQKLLAQAQPRLLDDLLAPLRTRLDRILTHPRLAGDPWLHRVRILAQGQRAPEAAIFEQASAGLIQRRRLDIFYRGRSTAERAELNAHFTRSYGIFAGPPRHEAVLRFTPERARWVAEETWFPGQQGEFLEDGSYLLRLPYSESPELVMDILKYGPDVEVLEPEQLREEVRERLRAALGWYEAGEGQGADSGFEAGGWCNGNVSGKPWSS